MAGYIRVGKRIGSTDATYRDYSIIPYPFNNKSITWPLSPMSLTTDNDQLLCNVWTFSRIYPSVTQQCQLEAGAGTPVVWEWPSEAHMDDNGNILPRYWEWRQAGMASTKPVKYPNGFKDKDRDYGYVLINDDGSYDIISKQDARVNVLYKMYKELVVKQPIYQSLKERVANGENLVIQDTTGPNASRLQYYRANYDVPMAFIVSNTVQITPASMNVFIKDMGCDIGYGFWLAAALLDLEF